ncbi:ABC transporter ATP-binding protein [Candidatus Peregrinibacteria bacterium CG_4_10_14_0_2_um_filter_43_11]|nr:MAG: ABC transporter ATP-binding protein [Candidatus Peregrinibacteria bacterium CG_4_10_14_0_2_um_filter_43_11]
MLQVRDLDLHIGGLKILNHLTFDVPDQSITGLIGPNGAGKSMFFNTLFGLFQVNGGSIRFNDVELVGKKPHEISHLGIIRTFQDARLLPQITVLENLLAATRYAEPTTLSRVFFHKKALYQEYLSHVKRAQSLLKRVGLESKIHAMGKDLSYGQTKLIEILKLFMADNQVILLDEPFSGLFPEMIKIITELILELVKSGRTIMLVEHNMKLISEVCNHVIVMDAGTTIASGTFSQIRSKSAVAEAYLGD